MDAVYCCLTEVAAVVSTENNSVINKTMPAKCKLNFFLLIDDICEKKVYTWSQTSLERNRQPIYLALALLHKATEELLIGGHVECISMLSSQRRTISPD